MFVGHVGAGLAIKTVERRFNLGAALFACLFADLLLWALVIAGAESVNPPVRAGAARYFTFVFPHSHSVVATGLWSAIAMGIAAAWPGAPRGSRTRLAAAAGLAVGSHWILDFLVHPSDLPVTGHAAGSLGLGLWRHMPAALALELALAAAALVAFARGRVMTRGRTWTISILVAIAAILTVAGPYAAGDPPPAATLAISSLVALAAVVGVGLAVERNVATPRTSRRSAPGASA